MIRLPRLSPAVVLACSMAFPMLYGPERAAWGQEQPADAPAADTPADAAPADAAPADAAPADAAPAEADAQPAAAQDADAAPADAAPAEEMPAEAPADAPAEADAAPADAAPADAAPAAEDVTPADAPFQDQVEAFLHYGQLGRYDVAAIQGKEILDAGKQPAEILAAFEAVMERRNRARRGTTLEAMLDVMAQSDATKDVTSKLREVLNQARVGRMSDPKFIDQAIQDLITNERAYGRAVALLKQSGELAVPQLIDYLRDPKRAEFHARVQRALVDMGRQALNPLVSALEMKDPDTLVMIVGVLGDMGFEASVPYLVDLRDRGNTPDAVREAATVALRNMGAGDANNAGNLYYELAEKFYYETAFPSDKRYPSAFVWYVGNRGLLRKEVPHPIFNEVMAMRAARRALELRGGDDAQSLWLAANYKRETQLPQGAVDPTAPSDSAHFYGVGSGTQRLNAVLARAVRDRDGAVALRAIKSLQDIVGRANLFAGQAGQPLIEGMRSPDRLVRFESAFAVAAALPQNEFSGRERVVPLLAEAVTQTGTANVLVVAGTDDSRNAVSAELKGFAIAGATGGDAAINEAATLPSVDAIVFTADASDEDVTRVLQIAAETPRLDRAAKIVVRPKRGMPIERQYIRRRDVTFTDTQTGAGLTKLIEATRSKTGGAPLAADLATDYALRAIRLLNAIAKARGATVLDVTAAHQTLLNATADPRPEVVKEVANTLAWVNASQVQPALLAVATDEKTPPDVRVALFEGLAGNAKNFGNQLQQPQFKAVQAIVQKGDSPDLRNAAAEAAGALNLPGDQARGLILNWTVESAQGAQQTAQQIP